MKVQISPSMMCADIFRLEETISVFESKSIDYLHIDIMDGSFVPNYTLGTDYCKLLKNRTDIPLDIHLMIENPEDKIDWFDISAGDYVSVHAESTDHIRYAVSKIKQKGAKPMLAINPATPIYIAENVLNDIDGVLIMTVNPGFAGQKLIPSALEKIAEMRNFLDSKGYGNIEIEVDGNVSFENAVKMREKGADIFVAGTSSIFGKNLTLENGIDKFRQMVK